MKLLVVGSGAREHALVNSFATEPMVTELHAAPGNAGIAQSAQVHPLKVDDAAAVRDLAVELGVDFVVVGPEVPLVVGAADAVREAGIACFGPSAAAARLEASKAYAKQVMHAAGVPTARSGLCVDASSATVALREFGSPYVVKDDGLAAGKGVVVTNDLAEAVAHAQACFDKPDGRVVIEEYLDGPEISLFCVTDGISVVPLLAAQDFKRVGDADLGPNTGGMGAYAPLLWAPADLAAQVVRDVAQPTIDEMARRGTPFAGLLYVGLALTSQGMRVIEFNVRFGDPETQVVLAQLETPLSGLLHAAATGNLATQPTLKWREGASVTVVLAAAGYPSTPIIGDPITGIELAEAVPGVQVLHAGTAVDHQGAVVSSGGRVLSVVAIGADLAEARSRVYQAISEISLSGSHYRSDIAKAAVEESVVVPAGDQTVNYGPLGRVN